MGRSRRVAVGVAVALLASAGWDQSGILGAGTTVEAPSVGRSAGSPERSWDLASLSPRLRLPALASVPSDPATGEVALGLPAAEAAVAPAAPRAQADVPLRPPPASFPRQAVAPSPPPPPEQLRTSGSGRSDGPAVAPAGGTWAVLVGVNDYPGDDHDLQSAVNDVNDVNDALTRFGVSADRRLVMRDGQASADGIRSAVRWLTSRAGPDATAVFFFAGHVQKTSSSSEHLVGSDGGTIADTDLAALLEPLQAKRTWIAIAACYSGGFTEVVRPGRILTAAAPADSLAYENASFGRSYLVEYMVRRAMLQKGLPTVESAFAHAVAELKREHPNRVPVQQDQVGGELDLRTNPPPGRSPSSPPPSSPPPQQPPPEEGCTTSVGGVTVSCSG